MKPRRVKPSGPREPSSVFFQRLRPKFLDWEPPTEVQKTLEAQKRKDAREAELKRVTDLAKDREAEKAASRQRSRIEGGRGKTAT